LQPYSKFADAYYHNYVQTNVYSGAARDISDPDLKDLTEIRIGFLGPLDNNPEQVFGQRMLNGAQLAVDQANERGGYCRNANAKSFYSLFKANQTERLPSIWR